MRRERLGAADPYLEHRVVHVADDSGPIAQIETKTIDTNNAEPDNAIGDPVISYRYGNGCGSVVLFTDTGGSVIAYEEFHPWGTTAYRSAKPGVNLSLKPYRFGGKHRDEETGLYAFGARYYAAWLGRWTSSDPAGLASGSNLYRYCSNDPVGRTDANGMQDKPLSPHGGVSWVVPNEVFTSATDGKRLPDAVARGNFETWMRTNHPGRPFTPGSSTIDWKTMSGSRGPTFNAEWLQSNGRPLLPRTGQFGSVEPMGSQPRAEYTNPGTRKGRLSENEHGTPGAQERVADRSYSDSDYRNTPTTRTPRGVALDKTSGDNAASRQMARQAAAGQAPDLNEMDAASRDRFQAANERARAAGRPHIDNPGSIDRGTLEQIGERFERGKRQTLPAGAIIEEPDIKPTATPPSTPPEVPSSAPPVSAPSGGMRLGPSLMNAGGNFALSATRALVPGVAELEDALNAGSGIAFKGAAATAVGSARLSAVLATTGGALETAAAYTPVVGAAWSPARSAATSPSRLRRSSPPTTRPRSPPASSARPRPGRRSEH